MAELTPDARLLTARWALPVSSEPIENAALVFALGRIQTVCSQDALASTYSERDLKELRRTAVDYGAALLLPGFINLHTHLDYSMLQDLFQKDSENMFDWLPDLVTTSWGWTPEQWLKSATYGIEQSVQAGTTCIVDNSFTGQSARLLAKKGLRALVGLELFGQDESLADAAWQRWLEKYDRVTTDAEPHLREAIESGRVKITVSPHAPYTVAPALWKKASEWAEQNNLKVLAHLAESREECDWISSSNDRLDEYLLFMRQLQVKAGLIAYKNSDAPPTPWRGKGLSPCALLSEHGLLNERLVATHVVQVDDADIISLKNNKVNVVHCPRSNMHLKHGIAPLEKLRKQGLRIGLGTDSLASAPDLSMVNEAKATRKLHAAQAKNIMLSAEEALALITLQAAAVIGWEAEIGSLETGKYADLVIFNYDDFDLSGSPAEHLFSADARAVTVYVQGNLVSSQKNEKNA